MMNHRSSNFTLIELLIDSASIFEFSAPESSGGQLHLQFESNRERGAHVYR